MVKTLLALTGFLILYGSLYPFNFTAAAPHALEALFTNWTLFTTRGDLLGNIALFVPWGVIGMAAWMPRRGTLQATGMCLVVGAIVAVGAQVAQIWVPSRDAAMADVVWNLVGTIVGIAIGVQVQRSVSIDRMAPRQFVAAGLLAGWVLSEWLPLIPSLDLQLLKDQLKSLASPDNINVAAMTIRAALVLLVGQSLRELEWVRSRGVVLVLACATVMAGQLFIRGSEISLSTIAGTLLGLGGWIALSRVSDRQRPQLIFVALLAAYTLGSLAPFRLRDYTASMHWIPFAAMLEGSMLINLRALLANLVLLAGMLHMVQVNGTRPLAISVVLAFWVMGMELLQLFIATRTSDITEPLLVLLLGQVMAMAPAGAPTAVAPRSSAAAHTPPRRRHRKGAAPVTEVISLPWRRGALVAGVAVMVIVAAMWSVLRLPNVPYNVRDLFRGGGNVAAITCFALAVLWIGAGATVLARFLRAARWPEWLLPPAAFSVCLISLMFLWSGVTTESLEDIAGSANVDWFVRNNNTWGDTWRQIFVALDAHETISFIEYCVRYSALYATPTIFLACVLVMKRRPHEAAMPVGRFARMLVSAGLTLWLCKAIAFDWSSTDNLNELIEPDGEWGWGGGGYLYALVALLCCNAIALSTFPSQHNVRRIVSTAGLVLSAPASWWLLNLGLNDHIEKYGAVFSGAQFLLGPDRTHLLSTHVLLLRWIVVFMAGVLVIATGLWVGRHVPWPRRRPGVAQQTSPRPAS